MEPIIFDQYQDESEDDVPEISDEAEVLDSFTKLSSLLRQFENDNTEWSNDLYEELNNPVKQNLVNRIHVQDRGNEFFQLLGAIDDMPDRSEEFEYSQELLNPFKLDKELTVLLSHVDKVKIKSSRRMEKLHSSFGKVKNAQAAVIDRIVKRIRVDTGLSILETKVEEYTKQVDNLKASLIEKRQIIQRNNREKDLSAEELRHKHERETEDRVRLLMADIESRNKELALLSSAHDALTNSSANLQNDLGVLIHQLEVEERTAPLNTAPPVSMNPAQRFRASIYRHAASKGKTPALFADVSSGAITKELVVDAQKALEEAFEKQQSLYTSITATDERIVALRKELTVLMQSEENKALDRLKKVCDNLQVKIQSDEQRIKVMATLVLQMEQAELKKGQLRKTVVDMSKGKGNQMSGQLSSLRSRPHAVSHKQIQNPKDAGNPALSAHSLKSEMMAERAAPAVDFMPLVRDISIGGDRESISMKLHRRLYSQFYEAPVINDAPSSETDSDAELKPTNASASASAKSRKLELPRKRRITASQSRKIQKIMDMINLQYTKLSSMKSADIKHILDYRDFAEEIEQGSSSNSSHSGSAKSLRSLGSAQVSGTNAANMPAPIPMSMSVPKDHTKLFPTQPGIIGSTYYEGNIGACPSKPGTANEREREKEGSPERDGGGGGSRAPRSATKSPTERKAGVVDADEHLRIPTTAALEDDNDADFFAQNYGIKLALEHLNAFMEVLTNGRGSDAAFLSTADDNRHTRVSFARDEQEELHTVEGLRGNIQKLISLIRELHFLSQNAKHLRKDLQKEVDTSLKECDKLRNQLLLEIEGSHWPTEMKAGQYEVEIDICKAKIKELKSIAKQWDHRVSLKRAQNIRLSQMISKASASRRTVVHKLPAYPEERTNTRPNRTASPGEVETSSTEKKAVLNEYNYTVANKRMSIFDDISHIYDTAMSHIRQTDSAIPYHAADNNSNSSLDGMKMSLALGQLQQETPIGSAVSSASRNESEATMAGGSGEDNVATGAGKGIVNAPTCTYTGFEEDQGSDGWEDVVNGYEGGD